MSFRFNNGNGAVICDTCRTVIREPATREDSKNPHGADFYPTKDLCTTCQSPVSTCRLDAVRERPACFTWGEVKKIYDLGPYTFVYYRDKTDDEDRWHVYVNDGKDTSRSCRSLEEAMVMAVSYTSGNERCSPGATHYIMKMLKKEP